MEILRYWKFDGCALLNVTEEFRSSSGCVGGGGHGRNWRVTDVAMDQDALGGGGKERWRKCSSRHKHKEQGDVFIRNSLHAMLLDIAFVCTRTDVENTHLFTST